MEFICQSVHRHRQRNHPRRVFQRWRCYMDARKSATTATSHRHSGWSGCGSRSSNGFAHNIHHRRKDVVTGHRRKRDLRNRRGECGEIRTNQHRGVAKWAYMGRWWYSRKRYELSCILSKWYSMVSNHQRNRADNECSHDYICTGGANVIIDQRRHDRRVRCRKWRVDCWW